jgi:hypothetical protein
MRALLAVFEMVVGRSFLYRANDFRMVSQPAGLENLQLEFEKRVMVAGDLISTNSRRLLYMRMSRPLANSASAFES